jgi:MFS family permease
MKAFVIIWFGQVISLLGSAMTTFALTIWAYQETGQATALALMVFFGFTPGVLLSPVAGALVDRWNRKLVMMLSDLGTGISTIAVLLLYNGGHLEIWHLYVAGFFAGVFQAFQFPAYSAAVTMMLPKEQYARASGMLSLAGSASGVLAPVVAGALLAVIGIGGIMAIDIVTFVFAIGALLLVQIPQPARSAAGAEGQGSLWQESLYGFRYIFRRRSLLHLQLVFFCINFISAFSLVLLPAMILARTGNDELILGSVQSIGAVGGVVGGVLLSTWGGPRRRIHGVLLGMLGTSLLSQIPMGLGRSLFVWGMGSFTFNLLIPILNGSNQAIWQAKVAPDVQGRVFAVRRLIAQITFPLATLLAGPLADQVMEPAMMPGGALAAELGWLVGTGPGAGMALIFILAGLFGAAVALGGYLFPSIRDVETLLPDHDAEPASLLPAAEPV